MLTEETKEAIKELQKLYPVKRSALIPALHLAQKEKGWLSSETQKEIALLFEIDPNEVQGVVSFYDMFFEKPVGKTIIRACKNVSCLLRGADETLAHLCKSLQIEPGETSADGEFTLLTSECLAACDLAPVLLVNEELIGPATASEADALLRKKEAEKSHG